MTRRPAGALVNPFELAHAELRANAAPESVLAAIDTMLRNGFTHGDRRYRLFGGRVGSAFSMSLGLPVLGGGTPVLRGRVRADTGPAVVDVSVGARHEVVLFTLFWGLLTVLGGGYQLALQLARVLAGRATWSAVLEVVPGVAVMAGLVSGGVLLWRWRARPQAAALLERFRDSLGATAATTPVRVTARPIH